MLLAIDTATRFAGLALLDESQVLAEESWYSAMAHSVELMPRIQRMLRTHGHTVESLKGIGVSLGPGSFTGLRIGLSAAKGLALPHRIPLVGIPTLDATAYPYRESDQPVWAVIQAGRGRINVAAYQHIDGNWKQITAPALTNIDGLCRMATLPATFVGEIDNAAASQLQEMLGDQATIPSPALRSRRPAYLAELAVERLAASDIDDLTTLAPIYLQTPDGQSIPSGITNQNSVAGD